MTLAEDLAYRIRAIHSSTLKVTEGLDDEKFHSRYGPNAPSIGFQVWHIARWADRLQARLSEMPGLRGRLAPRREIWVAEDTGGRWGLGSTALGYGATGMGIDEETSARLPLPSKDAVLSYAKAVFDAADSAVARVDDSALTTSGTDLYDRTGTVAQILLRHVAHAGRHLGMIEALRGVQGLRGTATE